MEPLNERLLFYLYYLYFLFYLIYVLIMNSIIVALILYGMSSGNHYEEWVVFSIKVLLKLNKYNFNSFVAIIVIANKF